MTEKDTLLNDPSTKSLKGMMSKNERDVGRTQISFSDQTTCMYNNGAREREEG